MLANITSYFWGSESETPCVDENEKIVKDCDNVPVTTKPIETPTPKQATPTNEDDWVMVNKSVNCTTPVLEEERDEQQENSQTNQQDVDDAQHRTPGVSSRAATLLQAIDVLRPQQKAQRRREERRLKHKHLIYGNKVREVASAGNGRSRRCHMMTPDKFSRAVNNRKC
jgi:hypothetical protein